MNPIIWYVSSLLAKRLKKKKCSVCSLVLLNMPFVDLFGTKVPADKILITAFVFY